MHVLQHPFLSKTSYHASSAIIIIIIIIIIIVIVIIVVVVAVVDAVVVVIIISSSSIIIIIILSLSLLLYCYYYYHFHSNIKKSNSSPTKQLICTFALNTHGFAPIIESYRHRRDSIAVVYLPKKGWYTNCKGHLSKLFSSKCYPPQHRVILLGTWY